MKVDFKCFHKLTQTNKKTNPWDLGTLLVWAYETVDRSGGRNQHSENLWKRKQEERSGQINSLAHQREKESSGKLINTKCPGRPKSETKLYHHSIPSSGRFKKEFERGLAFLWSLWDSAEAAEMTVRDRVSGAGSHDGTAADECRRTTNREVL